jgi:predicted aconitase with swiveling domain
VKAGWQARTLVPGLAEGASVVLAEPLSFWGGYDAPRGLISDRRHPDLGRSVAGRILVMTASRGSSSASSVLAEAIRAGTGPAGIVLRQTDPILTVGAMVALELYAKACPVVVASAADWQRICEAPRLALEAGEATAIICVSAQPPL